MSIVSNSIIQKYHYDKTIEAKIVSVAQKDKGIYKVSYEDGKFDAYSSNNTPYHEGEIVYVTVPQGDFSKQKYIVGRKVDDKDENAYGSAVVTLPFDNFVSLQKLTQGEIIPEKGYLANNPEHGKDIDNIELSDINPDLYDPAYLAKQDFYSEYTQEVQELTNKIKKYRERLKKYYDRAKNSLDAHHQISRNGHGYFLNTPYTELFPDAKGYSYAEDFMTPANQRLNNETPVPTRFFSEDGSTNTLLTFLKEKFNDYICLEYSEDFPVYEPNYDSSKEYDSTYDKFYSAVYGRNDADEEINESDVLPFEINDSNNFYAGKEYSNYIEYEGFYNAVKQHYATTNDFPTGGQGLLFDLNTFNRFCNYTQISDEEYKLLLTYITDLYNRWIYRLDKFYENKKEELNRSIYTQRKQLLYKDDDTDFIWHKSFDKEQKLFGTKLGITADFRTLLNGYHCRGGKYGLKIYILGKVKSTVGSAATLDSNTIYFTSDDMYGNIYNFIMPRTQQFIVDVSNYISLSEIIISFWQDHQFIDQYKSIIKYKDSDDILYPPNIFVSNLSVDIGLTVDECISDKLFLYTYDNLQYGYQDQSLQEEDKIRTLYFNWIHLDNNTPILINHYFKYNDADKSAFLYWKEKIGVNLNWYHYEYGCDQDIDDLAQRQGGANWKLLDIPIEDENFNQLVVTPNFEQSVEKWRAIISFDTTILNSNIIAFNNIDQSVETKINESNNEVILRLLKAEYDNNNEIKTIVADENLRDFFVYDENNRVLKDENNISYSNKWYYAQVWIKSNKTGNYYPLDYEINSQDIEVSWDFPTSSSMIAPSNNDYQINDDDLKFDNICMISDADGGNYIIDQGRENSLRRQRIKNITRKFKINPILNLPYTNNTISACIKFNNKYYRASIELHFGQAGSMGSPYRIQFIQLNPDSQCIEKNKRFELCANIVKKGTSVNADEIPLNKSYVFTWECLSPSAITINENDDYILSDEATINETSDKVLCKDLVNNTEVAYVRKWQVSDGRYFNGNVISGYLRNDNPPIFKVTVTGLVDYPISNVYGLKLFEPGNNTEIEYDANNYIINCPDRVEFKSDGTAPIAQMGVFSIFKSDETTNYLLEETYPEWELIQYKNNLSIWNELNTPDYLKLQKTFHSQQFLTENEDKKIYYLYESNGERIDYTTFSDQSFNPQYEKVNTYLEIIELIDLQYNNMLNSISTSETEKNKLMQYFNIDDEKKLVYTINKWNQYALEALQNIVCNNIPSKYIYALDPKATESSESKWIWDDSMENYYTVLTCVLDDNTIFKQAIAFARNIYSSSLLNSWDGHLLIDEAENALMSQMICAGTKDRNNTFTGVILGDWANRADSSLDIPGLYGLKNGEQVYGFKTDGTGFIGKSGRGRIEFDGNIGLISNYDKTMYLNLDPIVFQTDDKGHITYINKDGYSQYFLYAETSRLDSSEVEHSITWANKFINSKNKDYFIVDPNNGVLTTGGIVARYGSIGDWIISETGIYQKKKGATVDSSRYMYFGYPSAQALSQLDEIQARFKSKNQLLLNKKQKELDDLEEQYKETKLGLFSRFAAANAFIVDAYHNYNYGWPLQTLYKAIDETVFTIENNLQEQRSLREILEDNIKTSMENETRTHYHMHYTSGGGTGEPNYGIGFQYTGFNFRQYIKNISYTEMSVPRPLIPNETGIYGDVQYNTNISPFVTIAQPLSEHGYRNISFGNETSNQGTYSRRAYLADEFKNNDKLKNYINTIYYLPYFSTADNLTVEKLKLISTAYKSYYNVHKIQFDLMLDRMIEIGESIIKQNPDSEIWAAYLQELSASKDIYTKQRQEVEEKYRVLIDAAKAIKKEESENIKQDDKNKFAIYAGYNENIKNALFTVDWRGRMTARSGKIGEKSPWYISDEGLTQKNKFGTIFLGNPESKSNGVDWSLYDDGFVENIVTEEEIADYIQTALIARNKALNEQCEEIFVNNYHAALMEELKQNRYIINAITGEQIPYTDNDVYNSEELMNIYYTRKGQKLREILQEILSTQDDEETWKEKQKKQFIRDSLSSRILLPNDSENNTILVGERRYYKDTSGFANEEAGTPRMGPIVWLYNKNFNKNNFICDTNKRFNETHGDFAIYAGTNSGSKAKINFGVRMDGTLYSTRGNIGGLNISEEGLFKYDWITLQDIQSKPVQTIEVVDEETNESIIKEVEPSPCEIIAIDTEKGQIRLANNQIVLDGKKAEIFIGFYNQKEDMTYGRLYMGRVNIYAQTQGKTTYSFSGNDYKLESRVYDVLYTPNINQQNSGEPVSFESIIGSGKFYGFTVHLDYPDDYVDQWFGKPRYKLFKCYMTENDFENLRNAFPNRSWWTDSVREKLSRKANMLLTTYLYCYDETNRQLKFASEWWSYESVIEEETANNQLMIQIRNQLFQENNMSYTEENLMLVNNQTETQSESEPEQEPIDAATTQSLRNNKKISLLRDGSQEQESGNEGENNNITQNVVLTSINMVEDVEISNANDKKTYDFVGDRYCIGMNVNEVIKNGTNNEIISGIELYFSDKRAVKKNNQNQDQNENTIGLCALLPSATGSYFGLPQRTWTIYANNIFIGGKQVATQDYVNRMIERLGAGTSASVLCSSGMSSNVYELYGVSNQIHAKIQEEVPTMINNQIPNGAKDSNGNDITSLKAFLTDRNAILSNLNTTISDKLDQCVPDDVEEGTSLKEFLTQLKNQIDELLSN